MTRQGLTGQLEEAQARPGRPLSGRPDEPGGVTLMRLFGVEVRLDWGLLIIFSLVTFNLGFQVLPRWHPDWSALGVWALALGAAVLFFASLLAHELAHAFVGRTQGIPIRRVTLYLFGGLAHMEAQPPSPRAEFLMAAVGPLVSLGLGTAAVVTGTVLAQPSFALARPGDMETLLEAVRGISAPATLLLWLGIVNLGLGAFNLIPAFPLDGGRLLRAVLWGATGDMVRATRWASGTGRAFAWTLMAVGVMNVFGGALVQGLWLVLIGWFLNGAARTSYERLLVQRSLEDVPVSRVMRSRLDRVAPDLSLEELVRDHVMPSDQRAFPVEREGELLGLVTFDDLRRVPQQDWADTAVAQVMTPAERLSTLPPGAGADAALEELGRHEVEQIPVVEGHHLLGLVRRQDLVRWLALQHGAGEAQPRV